VTAETLVSTHAVALAHHLLALTYYLAITSMIAVVVVVVVVVVLAAAAEHCSETTGSVTNKLPGHKAAPAYTPVAQECHSHTLSADEAGVDAMRDAAEAAGDSDE
jgi:hypothetical protein